MTVAIVIPTKDASAEMSSRAIDTARRTSAHLRADINVVESSGPGFRFSRSINTGIARSPDADAWVLLNDDAFMDDGWLDALLEASRAHPEVGVWGGVLRFPHGGGQFAGGEVTLTPAEFLRRGLELKAPFWALRKISQRRFRQHAYMFNHYRTPDPHHRLDFITGACYLITRACFEKVGGFDERYQFGAEDVDHSLRTLEGGFELGIAKRATGVHLDGGSGMHQSPKQLASLRVFDELWSPQRIRAATRKPGRRGTYHP